MGSEVPDLRFNLRSFGDPVLHGVCILKKYRNGNEPLCKLSESKNLILLVQSTDFIRLIKYFPLSFRI